MTHPNSDFYFSPQFVEEFGLPDSLQLSITPLDWVENPDDTYNAPLEERYPTHVLGNEGLPSDSDPSGLSMGPSGQLYFPGTVSHEPRGNNFSSCSYPNPLYEPAQYNYASRAVPLDSHSTQHFNTSHNEYLDQYGTDWELEMHLFSNSQEQLPEDHIGRKTLSDSVSPYDVRQSYQEPGYLPASGYKFNGRESHVYPLETLPQGVEPLNHDSQPSGYLYPEATATDNIPSAPYFSNLNVSDSSLSSFPSYHPSCQSIPRYQHPLPATSFFTSPAYLSLSTDTALPPVVPAPYSYPSEGNDLPQGAHFSQFRSPIYPMLEVAQNASTFPIPAASHPSYPTQSRSCDPSPPSSFSSPPYPITPIDNTTRPITLSLNPTFLPARQISKRNRPSPPKKLARTPKKASPPVLHEPKLKRGLPGGRAPVQSQEWLDKYYPNRGPCTLCKEKKKGKGEGNGEENVWTWRRDRALEHLVSTHIVQVVKKMVKYDKGFLDKDSTPVKTEAQFGFAQDQVQKMRCSLCPNTPTSLVFRGPNIRDHLINVHADLPESVLQKEVERVRGLMPKQAEWYSYEDKFLYDFPRN